jgi:hypothetical protein
MINRFLKTVVPLALLLGCSRTEHLVFVVPNNFRGVLKLQTKQLGAEELAMDHNWYVIRFPESGVLQMKGKTPLQQWHTSSARYVDGKPLAVVTHGAGISNAISFRYVGLGKSNDEWFVVGTFEDLKDAMDKKDGFRAPF